MTLLTWLSIAGVGAAAVLAGAWVVARRQAGQRRQMRLDRAFDRAQRVQGAGTGEQGRPYSLYGKRSWRDDV